MPEEEFEWDDKEAEAMLRRGAIDVGSTPRPASLPALRSPDKGDQSRMQELLAASTLSDDMPRHFQPEGDTFGLFEVEDTYERFLGLAYLRARNLVIHQLPDLGPNAQMAWHNGERVLLPAKKLGDIHSFQMAADDESIRFLRADDLDATKGFIVRQLPNGHIVVRDERHGDSNPQDDVIYGDMVDKAIRFIDDYCAQFGLTAQALTAPFVFETKWTKRRKKVARLSPLAVWRRMRASGMTVEEAWKALSGWVKKHTPKQTRFLHYKSKREKNLSPIRCVILILLLPIPFLSDGIAKSGPLSHVPRPWEFEILDRGFNRSENTREAFDRRGLHLPAVDAVERGEAGPIPYVEGVDSKITRAPTVTTDSGSAQDVHGGIRVLQDLGRSYSTGLALDVDKCDGFDVLLESGENVRVLTTDSNVKGALQIKVQRDRLSFCNISTAAIDESRLNEIYIEVGHFQNTARPEGGTPG